MFPSPSPVEPMVEPSMEAAGIEPAQDSPGYIYLISNGDGQSKIGYAADPLRRLALLQIGSARDLHLEGCFRGTPRQERDLHELFAGDHFRGEWFYESQELTDAFTHLEDRSLTRGNRRKAVLARLRPA